MNQNIINIITERYNTLSKGHKAIANFVLENYDKAAYMNVEQLSRVTGVSEATVVRFSAEMAGSLPLINAFFCRIAVKHP